MKNRFRVVTDSHNEYCVIMDSSDLSLFASCFVWEREIGPSIVQLEEWLNSRPTMGAEQAKAPKLSRVGGKLTQYDYSTPDEILKIHQSHIRDGECITDRGMETNRSGGISYAEIHESIYERLDLKSPIGIESIESGVIGKPSVSFKFNAADYALDDDPVVPNSTCMCPDEKFNKEILAAHKKSSCSPFKVMPSLSAEEALAAFNGYAEMYLDSSERVICQACNLGEGCNADPDSDPALGTRSQTTPMDKDDFY